MANGNILTGFPAYFTLDDEKRPFLNFRYFEAHPGVMPKKNRAVFQTEHTLIFSFSDDLLPDMVKKIMHQLQIPIIPIFEMVPYGECQNHFHSKLIALDCPAR